MGVHSRRERGNILKVERFLYFLFLWSVLRLLCLFCYIEPTIKFFSVSAFALFSSLSTLQCIFLSISTFSWRMRLTWQLCGIGYTKKHSATGGKRPRLRLRPQANISMRVCAIPSEAFIFLPKFRGDSNQWKIRLTHLGWPKPIWRFRDFD